MVEIILDASQLNVFEACPFKWYLDYHKNLTTKRTNPSLSTGSFYHAALKHYYSSGFAPLSKGMKATLEYAVELANGREAARWPAVNKNPKFYLDRLRSYLFNRLLEDDEMEVIAVEQGFSWLLFEDANRRYIVEGMIDLVCHRKPTGLTVVDHKTQSRFSTLYPFNHQCLNYLYFTGAKYFMYNYIGLQENQNDNTFHRDYFAAPPGIFDEWKIDIKNTFDEMAMYLRQGVFPRRRHACDSEKYGTCQFYQICKVNTAEIPIVLNNYKQKEERWKAWT